MVSQRQEEHGDQRRSRRYRSPLAVDLHEREGVRRVTAIDVGRHGLFLALTGPPQERHLVQLTLHIPSGPIRVAAKVVRTRAAGGDGGVGVQLFVLSHDAKERWDAFIAQLRDPSAPVDDRPSSDPLSDPSRGPATYLVKLRTVERLRAFQRAHIVRGGMQLVTPVLRAVGDAVSLVVVHPVTDEELHIAGVVTAVHTDRPKRLEIKFVQRGRAQEDAFEGFVETGVQQPELAVVVGAALEAPAAAPSATPAADLDFDVDVLAGTNDDEMIDWADDCIGDELVHEREDGPEAPAALGVAPLPIAAEAAEPHLAPTTFTLRCADDACPAAPYDVQLGPADGFLGLVADHRALWCAHCKRVTACLAPAPGEERSARLAAFGDVHGKRVPLTLVLAAAALGEHATCALCAGDARPNRNVDRLMAAARRLEPGGAPAHTRVRCAGCERGTLVVTRVDFDAEARATRDSRAPAAP